MSDLGTGVELAAEVKLHWDDDISDPGAEDCSHCGPLNTEVVAASKPTFILNQIYDKMLIYRKGNFWQTKEIIIHIPYNIIRLKYITWIFPKLNDISICLKFTSTAFISIRISSLSLPLEPTNAILAMQLITDIM